ncbi:MAG: D-sedoheptulose 7-phosphate isomerase [Nanoarchaeota archaeon]
MRENMEVKQAVIDTQLDKIERLANYIVDVYKNHKKILIFGNGGSAADAQHFAAELVGRYKMERQGLPAIALTTDTSAITAIANDYGYDEIFSRQVEALANSGDLVVGITTSGNSPNVILALEKAKKIGCKTVGFGGKDGGKLKDIADMTIIVPSSNTPRIQETHITIIHIVCELLEKEMAPHWRAAA